MKKLTYVLTVSQFFPKTHKKSGLPTDFIDLIISGIKKHTIRGNYDLWAKRIEKINRGEAVLSVRYWTGKPYNSKQKEVFVLEEIGIEKIEWTALGWFVNDYDSSVLTSALAKNDGLSTEDFKNWFKGYDFLKPMAIIHFSKFRYGTKELVKQ